MLRTIDSAIWTDPRVMRLSPEAKLLFLYLITNPHTHVSGIYYLPMVAICHEIGISEKKIRYPIDTLSEVGLVKIDDKLNVIWVINMYRYQSCGDKTRRSAGYHLAEDLHNSDLIRDFLAKYEEVRPFYDERNKSKNRYPNDRVSQVGPPVSCSPGSCSPDNASVTKVDDSKSSRFKPPTIVEVKAYCVERGNSVDAESFIDHYESNGWRVGRSPMKSWRASVRRWEKNSFESPKKRTSGDDDPLDLDEIRRQSEERRRQIDAEEAAGEASRKAKKEGQE